MKIEIFKLKQSNDDKFYVSLSQSDNNILELSELFLAGYITEEIISVRKEDIELISNPSASWKAAFLVWRNSVIKDEIENTIRNYEPRVDLIDVIIDPDYDNNNFNVTVNYFIVGIDALPQQLSFALQPTR